MVSVVIPVYNGEEFLEKCLKSLTRQSYNNLEIIVINDGSTDGTASICKKIAQEDERVRVLYQKKSGVSAARNRGISAAKGEFVLFVDADDLVPTFGIEKLRNAANTGADWVIGSHIEFRGNVSKQVIRKNQSYDTLDSIRSHFYELDGYISTPWAKLYKRQVIEKAKILFDETLPFGEDHVFNLFYSKAINAVQVIDSVVYQYRLGGYASSVKYHADHHKNHLALLKAYAAYFEGTNNIPPQFLSERLCKQMKASMLHYIIHCSRKETLAKLEETKTIFSEYIETEKIVGNISEEAKILLKEDSTSILFELYRKSWKRIFVKKIKIFATRILKTRI